MRQLSSLVWKEWREVHAFLWIGLGVFVGLPVIGAVEALAQHARRFEVSTQGWVIPFAGVLAIFVAVGTTCRDFGGRVEEFWRAQPIGVFKPLLVKFLIGLAVVLTVCILPLLLEWKVNTRADPMLRLVTTWFPFVWTAVYSIGFAAGCLIRRTAHAAMLSLSAMLLVYFLPLLVPPLRWLSVQMLIEGTTVVESSRFIGPAELRFAIGMLSLALAGLAVALMAIRYHWHVESGRKLMYGAVASAILILFATAAFQVGTNLPVLQEVNLPSDERVVFAHMNGTQGFIVSQRDDFEAEFGRSRFLRQEWFYRSVEVNGASVSLGVSKQVGSPFIGMTPAWDPQRPAVSYSAVEYVENGKDACYLWQQNHATTSTFARTGERKLWEYDREGKSLGIPVSVYIAKGQIYVIGSRLARLNLDEGFYAKPSITPISYAFGELFVTDRVIVPLPPIAELTARQRLEAVVKRDRWSLEGDVLCVVRDESLLSYRLTHLTDASATFELTGRYEETILEAVFGSFRYTNATLQNGLLYLSNNYGQAVFNPHVTVFDARPGHRFRPIGHFAAPGTVMIACPLPDGSALMAGSKVWRVGPPPLRD